MNQSIYITTPLFYPTNKPHLGHAYSTVIADVLKKYHQLIGNKVYLLTGADQHGEKIYRKALEANIPTAEFINTHTQAYKDLWTKLGIDFDNFYETRNPTHQKFVQETYTTLHKSGQIYQGRWTGYYCVSCEENYSAQSFERSKLCNIGHELTLKDEESSFLNLKEAPKFLKNLFQSKALDVKPSRYIKELENNFISNLEDLSITRKDLVWGIKTVEDQSTIYVWFDALLSYLGGDSEKLWDQKNTKIIQVLGKDIVRFHAIYWQTILKFLNKKNTSKMIVHGWLLSDNQKMSNSLNNIIDPALLCEKYGKSSLRFYLASLNWDIDHKFSENEIVIASNTFLCNTYGNLINRLFGLLKKNHYQLPIPKNEPDKQQAIWLKELIADLISQTEEFPKYIKNENISGMLTALFELLKKSNKLIDESKPWNMDPNTEVYAETMMVLYRVLTFSTWSLSPIIGNLSWKVASELKFALAGKEASYFAHQKNFKSVKLSPLLKPFFERFELIEQSEAKPAKAL